MIPPGVLKKLSHTRSHLKAARHSIGQLNHPDTKAHGELRRLVNAAVSLAYRMERESRQLRLEAA